MSDVKMITCPACQKKISAEASNCPKCGQPISEEVKTKAINKKIEEKKNARIGCLAIVLFIVIFTIYDTITAPDKYFDFYEKDFMAEFMNTINWEGFKKEFGVINCTNIKSEKAISRYKLNDDAELRIKKDSHTGKVREIKIHYDDRFPYDESVVIGAVRAITVALFYFTYMRMDNTLEFSDFVRDNVMSLPRNERGRVSNETFKYGRPETKEHEALPVISVEIHPAFCSISFIAEEGAPTHGRPPAKSK